MKKQILLGLLAVGMLAACGNDDSLNENGNSVLDIAEGQPAFINVAIAMPSEPQTRANDDFNDGDATEYAVNSGKLVLFKGASESAAKLISSYDINPMVAFSDDTDPQVTQSSKPYVQEITSPSLGSTDKLYAYVILNYSGNATGIDFSKDQTFSDFSQKVLKAIGIKDAEATGFGSTISDGGLVMTSVPLSTAAGGSSDPSTGTIQTLTEINKKYIYKTKEDAEKSTNSACIFVERAAAKVTVTFTPTTVDGSTMKAALVGWSLGNVNSSATGYYNTRQVLTDWSAYKNEQNSVSSTKYRFVSVNALAPAVPASHAHQSDLYRTYFGKDVNYSGTATLANSKIAADKYGFASGSSAFTYENTFDADNQFFGNTTFVGFKVKLNDGATFYKIGAQIYATQSDVETQLGKMALDADASTINGLTAAFEAAIAADLSNASSTIIAADASVTPSSTITYKLTPVAALDATTPINATTGVLNYKVTLSITNIKVDGAAASSDVETALEAFSTYTAITGYTLPDTKKEAAAYGYADGYAYYAVRIAHFGDFETPWSAPNSAYNDYLKIYPTTGVSLHDTPIVYGASRAAAWLGRWGVVRNNWYQITADKIVGIGSPVPVDYSGTTSGTPGGTPDDNPEVYYIAAHIHILPWVIREQHEDLK